VQLVDASPEVASLADVAMASVASLHQPPEPATVHAPVAETTGFVASILNAEDFVDSTLPATSVEENVTVCDPSADTVNGAVYVCEAPPSIAYVVLAMPEVESLGVNVTVTPLTYQPFEPAVPARLAVVTGPVASILNATDFVDSTLPAASVEKNVTVCDPSAPTLKGAAYVCDAPPSIAYVVAPTPDVPSVADSVTVTAPL
jgi:hypothetical protein